jgi:glycosyltransferase involved in cell wall biosynthesis
MKHIVIVAREYSESTGTYARNLINQLQILDKVHHYTVIIKSKDKNKLNIFNKNFSVYLSDIKEFSFAEQIKLLKQIKSLQPDLVHFTMTQQPIMLKKIPVITTIHDLTTIRFNNPAKNLIIFKIKQQVYKLVLKKVAKKSRLIITPSNFVKQDLIAYTNISSRKLRVIYEAGEIKNKQVEPIKSLIGRDFLFYVGRATTHKNLINLIKAFEITTKTHPKLLLVLGGKLDQNYLNLKNNLNKDLKNKVFFTGFLTPEELNWLYTNALAYVFPSLSEGFGLPGLEAMEFGLPIASSKSSCLPEIYQSAAIYFNPKDIHEMAHVINRVLDDSSLRKKLIQEGYIRIKSFSWKKTAHQTLECYQELIG